MHQLEPPTGHVFRRDSCAVHRLDHPPLALPGEPAREAAQAVGIGRYRGLRE